jgi:hypothetical protein
MTIDELIAKLDKLGIPESYYSLFGSLKADSIILHHSYHEWQVFYYDERGGTNAMRIFNNESDACEYIYNRLYSLKETNKRFNIQM